MIVSLTCPECGNKFEIEESHQAKERQAAALKEQQEEADKEKKEWEQKLLSLYSKDTPENKTEAVADTNEEGKK